MISFTGVFQRFALKELHRTPLNVRNNKFEENSMVPGISQLNLPSGQLEWLEQMV